jgi:hypothetical protein
MKTGHRRQRVLTLLETSCKASDSGDGGFEVVSTQTFVKLRNEASLSKQVCAMKICKDADAGVRELGTVTTQVDEF